MNKNTVIGILSVLLLVSLYFNFKEVNINEDFKKDIVVLEKKNDSLKVEIAKDDSVIVKLAGVSDELNKKLAHQRPKIVKITQFVEVEKEVIATLEDKDLISHFNKRYPVDTVTNPLPLAQPVLVSAAKDLAEFDGLKQIVAVKDTTIALQEKKIEVVNQQVNVYQSKEEKYKSIVSNQDIQISGWKTQYNALELQNKKLKLQGKFSRIIIGALVGGLTYTILTK